MPTIGIDLGTIYSCVGVWRDGTVEVLQTDQGNRTMSSCVAFTDTERLIGDTAMNQVAMNPMNTIYDVKRLIGRKFDDPKIQEGLKYWAFRIISESRKPKIQIEYKGVTKKFTPEEITSMFLIKMKEIAEAYLGTAVQNAVITVPSYFNDSQRQATKDAGAIAGLNVLRLINETTAAALAFGLDKNLRGERNVLIYDLGGGTFDVSVLTIIEGSLFEVKASAGNPNLGGEDFDNRLVDYLADEFQGRYNKDLCSNPRAFRRLRSAAERTKRILSSCTEASIEIDSLYEGIDFRTRVTRTRFEELNSDLFGSTVEIIEKVLIDAKMHKSQIHDIVLVGGSTRIPRVQKLVQNFFGGRKLNLSLNPDEAVAYGAAVQAAILGGEHHSKIQNVIVVDVAPFSFGLETSGGIMTKIVRRNCKIPCKQIQGLTTYIDNQSSITIQIYEGERKLTKDNNMLGFFELTGIPPAPRGDPQINVAFEIDVNGILNLTAKEVSSGRGKKIDVTNDKGLLSQADIKRMRAATKQYKEDDKEQQAKITGRNQLESYVFGVKEALDDFAYKISDKDRVNTNWLCDEKLRWLDNVTNAAKEEYDNHLKELQQVCDPIMAKIRGFYPGFQEIPMDLTKESIIEEIIVKNSTVGEFIIEEFSVEESTTEKLTVEETTLKEPIVKESAVAESGVEESAVKESAVEKSAVEEYAVKESATVESAIKESTVEESTVGEFTVEETTVEESTVEQSTVEETTVEESNVEESTVKESTVAETTVEESTLKVTSIEEVD